MVDTLYPAVGMAALELLERHGVDVVFPGGQTCCGQPAFNAGYRAEARKMARHFVLGQECGGGQAGRARDRRSARGALRRQVQVDAAWHRRDRIE
ncbi:MAG: (Fe-S)-binding protein [Gemmatimonadetes bacterium]|nr:(Fe-S)-binding protein [Gemmatimonadota bacterium]